MAKKEKKQKRARLTKERVQRWLNIQNEEGLYFILQLVFCSLQILLTYITFAQDTFVSNGIGIFLAYAATLLLLAITAWQYTVVRVFSRILIIFLFFGLSAMFIEVAINSHWDNTVIIANELTKEQKIGTYISDFLTYVHSIAVLSLPVFIVGSRRIKKKFDIVLLRINACLLVGFSVGTLLVYYEPIWKKGTTRLIDFCAPLFGSITAGVLLWVYVITSLALVFAVFMLYPFGTKRIKTMVEKARAKVNKE